MPDPLALHTHPFVPFPKRAFWQWLGKRFSEGSISGVGSKGLKSLVLGAILWGAVPGIGSEQERFSSSHSGALVPVRQQTEQQAGELQSSSSVSGGSGPIRVRLASGRELIGHLDLRTNGDELWIRTGTESLNMLRPIAWQEVREMVVDGRPVPPGFLEALVRSRGSASGLHSGGSPPEVKKLSEEEIDLLPPSLREFVRRVQTTLEVPAQKTPRRIVLEGEPFETETPGLSAQTDEFGKMGTDSREIRTGQERAGAPLPGGFSARVSQLQFDVWLGQWDDDVEADGLVVEIAPCGADGQVVPVHGMLEVILVIPPRGCTQSLEQKSLQQRWVQRVRPEDFSPLTGKAQYRMAFGSAQRNPEWNLALAHYGAVTAQLNVPGQGTFAATVGSVRVRPWSPVRDRLEQSTGERFFPWERTHP